MSDTRVQPGPPERAVFLKREAAEVLLLLDFLSGQAERSVRPTPGEQADALLQAHVTNAVNTASDATGGVSRPAATEAERGLEADLREPARLIPRVMRIRYPAAGDPVDFENDAAFLMRARDLLNARAAPATGATIAFTTLVSSTDTRTVEMASAVGDAIAAYPSFQREAGRLNRSLRWMSWGMVAVLILAIGVSGYTAWGKVMLDVVDVVRHDDTATQDDRQKLVIRNAQAVDAGAKPPGGPPPEQDPAASPPRCPPSKNVATDSRDLCHRLNDIVVRKETSNRNLERWFAIVTPWAWRSGVPADTTDMWSGEARRKSVEQQAVALSTVLGNYIMPLLYGLIGSFMFVLRRYHSRYVASLLSPNDARANRIRLLLGASIGGCIGLIYSGSTAAQTSGSLGLSITLSASAVAFLAGYGVEGVFKMLDETLSRVFQVNGAGRAPPPTPPK